MSARLQQACIDIAAAIEDLSQSELAIYFNYLKFAGNTDRAADLPSDLAYNEVYGQE